SVTASSEGERSKHQPFQRFMEEVAAESMKTYRNLIDHDDFWSWYTSITPIEHISNLPITSRPTSRGSADEADFENLRAIPWNFAWIQTRYIVPAWYGSGAAFQKLSEDHEDAYEHLQKAYKNQIFFRTVLDNAQREMVRTYLQTAKAYNFTDDEPFDEMINEDFKEAREAVLKIT